MQIEITVQDGKIVVSGPYSAENNDRYRTLGGQFSGGAWVLPDTDSVRAALAEMFGVRTEPVAVLVPLERADGYGTLQIGGYVLAQRRFRDSRVIMPDGVSLSAGSFAASGGSVKNPRVAASPDAVFRLIVRREFAERMGLEMAPEVSRSSVAV